MSNRDTRRIALRERLEAAFRTDAPSHSFHESASFVGHCLCGMPQAHPVHATEESEIADKEYPGVMIALYPSQEVASQLAVKGGEDASQLHVTLAYLGKWNEDGDLDGLGAVVAAYAASYNKALSGEVSGLGVFSNAAGAVTYASVDLPDLPDFRQGLVAAVEAAGFEVSKSHGYTPHMTLAYEDKRNIKVPNVALDFDTISVAAGPNHKMTFPLVLTDEQAAELAKKKKSKHPYVSRGFLGGYYGAPCLTCGKPANDPDHDGDVDGPGDTDGDAPQLGADDDPSPTPDGVKGGKKAAQPHPYSNAVAGEKYVGEYPPCDLCGQAKNSLIHGDSGLDDLVDSATVVSTSPKLAVGTTYLSGPQGPATVYGSPNATGFPAATASLQQSISSNPVTHLMGIRTTPALSVMPALDLPDVNRAFTVEVNGHTLVTAPASSFNRQFSDGPLNSNPHMQWMEGRFVGGEKANRNGAFWSTGDLEMGNPTVKYGPLNWLHEARHVIGCLADSKLVSASLEHAADLDQPYISVAAAIWKWIYPDEAEVVQQASDQGKLWYSMECISDEVQCVGDNGCGAQTSYQNYIHQAAGSCRHMAERSAIRRFVNPTFLGGAIIVPPVRPGWAEADARVMQQASELAERAFDQAGRPDIPAAAWEHMMAEVIKFGEL